MNRRSFIAGGGSAAALASAGAALSLFTPSSDDTPRNTLFPYVGRYTTEAMGKSMVPGIPKYEDNYVGACAYRKTVFSFGRVVQFGWEAGGAWRGKKEQSGEAWCNGWITIGGFPVGGFALIKPGFGVGISVVTNTIGKEKDREQSIKGANAHLLGYLAPDFSIAPSAWPDNAALTYRVHHRSGGGGRIGRMHEGHNAQSIGPRVSW